MQGILKAEYLAEKSGPTNVVILSRGISSLPVPEAIVASTSQEKSAKRIRIENLVKTPLEAVPVAVPLENKRKETLKSFPDRSVEIESALRSDVRGRRTKRLAKLRPRMVDVVSIAVDNPWLMMWIGGGSFLGSVLEYLHLCDCGLFAGFQSIAHIADCDLRG
jgi:hypothetical protein